MQNKKETKSVTEDIYLVAPDQEVDTNDPLNALAEIFPDFGNTARALKRQFRFIEIAEEEITFAIASNPEKEKELNAAFVILTPTPLFQVGLTDQLYRAHCTELLERVIAGQDLNPGTEAEAIIVLSECSTKSPLTHDAAYLYFNLFKKRISDALDDNQGFFRESYPGAADEILYTIQRRAANQKRKKTYKESLNG